MQASQCLQAFLKPCQAQLLERILNRSAILTMSTSILKALSGKLNIKRHSPSIEMLWHFLAIITCLFINRGSYMITHVLLNLLIELRERDKMQG